MKRARVPLLKAAGTMPRKREHGVALVTALLLLLLLTAMSLAMVLAFSSDMLTNGYYRNFRASFYAADSGLAIVRQDMKNQIQSKIDTSGGSLVQPLAASIVTDVVNALSPSWVSATDYKSITGGSASDSIPAKFRIDPGTLTLTVSCATVGATNTDCNAPIGTPTAYNYTFKYGMTSVGQAAGNQKNKIEETGLLMVNIPIGPVTPTTFAGYGLFIANSNVCDGSYFASGTLSGPVFINNGCLTFGPVKYEFKGDVGCAGPKAGFQYSSGRCNQSANSSDAYKGTTIAPKFDGRFDLGVKPVALPDNDYNQKIAVVNGKGGYLADGTVDPTTVDLSTLKTATNVSCGAASSCKADGVYMNYPSGNALSGGGIYVQGDATVTLSAPAGTSQQVYTIYQKSTGITTTITVNNGANTTVMSSMKGGKNVGYASLSGVPMNANTGQPATMLYVSGEISSLSGSKGVQDGTALTITAGKNIDVTGDVTYLHNPLDANGNVVNDKGQSLGLFTNTGNIQLDRNGAGNIEIDASLATISDSKTASGGLTSIGDTVNYLKIVGGRIHNSLYVSNVQSRDVIFDPRFKNNPPPWFPSTTNGAQGPPAGAPQLVFQRQHWVNKASY
jgi:hypothetical protein